MRKNTTESDGGTDQRIEFFVATDSELQVAWRDTLDLEILGSILWCISGIGRMQ